MNARNCGQHSHSIGEVGAGPSDKDRCEDASRVWLPGIIGCIAGFLSDNEVACTLRLVCRATAQQFADRTTVRPAQPVPRWCFASECRRVCRGLTLSRRWELVRLTAASGDVANLQVAATETGCQLNYSDLEAAAGAGKLDMCRWLVGPGRVPWHQRTPELTAEAAAAGGHGEVVDWCLEPRGGVVLERYVFRFMDVAALRNGHEGLAWRLLDLQPPDAAWRDEMLCAAAEGCSLAGLQRAWERLGFAGAAGAELDPTTAASVLEEAAFSLTADWEAKCEFLLERGCALAEDTRGGVAFSESLPGSAAAERLAWLEARGVELTDTVLSFSAQRGDAVLVAYLLERGLRPSQDDFDHAARAVSVTALQALAAAANVDARYMPITAGGAAFSGSLAALSWLVETYGAEAIGGLTPNLFSYASTSGNVELMAWLLARGCGVDERAWVTAADAGCEAALELLSEWGCPMPTDGGPYYVAASKCGNVRTMAVLRRLGVSFGPEEGRGLFTRLASREVNDPAPELQALAWLLANGCGIDWSEAERAAEGRVKVLAWIAGQKTAEGGSPAPSGRMGGGGWNAGTGAGC